MLRNVLTRISSIERIQPLISNLDLSKIPEDQKYIEFDAFDWGFFKTFIVGRSDEVDSTEESQFRAAIRLSSRGGAALHRDLTRIKLDDMLTSGDSQFTVPEDKCDFSLTTSIAELRLTTHSNSDGRVSSLEVLAFRANGLTSALRIVQTLTGRLALLYSTTTKVPLFVDSIVVERVSADLVKAITFRVGYPVVSLTNGFDFGGPSLGIVDFFGPHLAEALKTDSPFWRVVCYYKVAYYYYGPLLNKLNKIRRDFGLSQPDARTLESVYPFDRIARDMIGKSYKNIVHLMRSQFRNVFAHFSTDESMTPLDAADEEAASRAAVLLKKIAFDAVADCQRDLRELRDAGWTTEAFAAVLASIDESVKRAR